MATDADGPGDPWLGVTADEEPDRATDEDYCRETVPERTSGLPAALLGRVLIW